MKTMTDNSGNIAIKYNVIASTKSRKPHPAPFILRLYQKLFEIGGRISPSVAGSIAYKLWLTPPRFKTPASEQKALKSATIEFNRIEQKDIATFIWGHIQPATRAIAQPSILLVHGWSGRGTQMGPFVEPLLDAGYRVISFDAPAHGKSSGKQTTLYEISDVIMAMQDIYGEFDAVISHSFGGPCTALAVSHGFKAKRIVSISPPATVIGLVDKFAGALHLTKKTRDNLVARIASVFGSHIWEGVAMKNLIKGIDIPGLVIHDAHDDDVSWEEGQAVAHAWNNAPFIITSGLGHRRILRDTAVIESALKFIKS